MNHHCKNTNWELLVISKEAKYLGHRMSDLYYARNLAALNEIEREMKGHSVMYEQLGSAEKLRKTSMTFRQ